MLTQYIHNNATHIIYVTADHTVQLKYSSHMSKLQHEIAYEISVFIKLQIKYCNYQNLKPVHYIEFL